MDIPTFSNMSYASGNMVVEDSSAVLAKNIANVIPTIHHNLKRALHLNLKTQPDFGPDSVPVIEVIPPSPPGRESKKSFVCVKLDKVLNQTIQVCRRYSMPYIHPEHLGDNLNNKDFSSRRSSMPAISNKYLLQVPKPEKKKRRRHSLPVNMEQARKSYKSLNEKTSKSHDDLSFDGRVHQVYISGFINDNDTFENINDRGQHHQQQQQQYSSSPKKQYRRKNNIGTHIMNKLVETNEVSTSTEYLSKPTTDFSDDDDDDDVSTSPEMSLVSCLSLPDLQIDDDCLDGTNLSLPSLIIEPPHLQAIENNRRTVNTATSLRNDCLYRTVSEPYLDCDEPPHQPSMSRANNVEYVNYATRYDDESKQQLRHYGKTNKQMNYAGDQRREYRHEHPNTQQVNINKKEKKTNNSNNSNNNSSRYISGDILLKRGNKKSSNNNKTTSTDTNQFKPGLSNEEEHELRNYSSNNNNRTTCNDYYLMKQQEYGDCTCQQRPFNTTSSSSTKARSQSVVEATYKNPARQKNQQKYTKTKSSISTKSGVFRTKSGGFTTNTKTSGVNTRLIDSSSCNDITSKFKSLSTIDHNSNIINDRQYYDNRSDFINNSGFVNRQTSCDAIKSKYKSNKSCDELIYKPVATKCASDQVDWFEGTSFDNRQTNNSSGVVTGRSTQQHHHHLVETYYDEDSEQYVNIDYYSASPHTIVTTSSGACYSEDEDEDENTCFNYDYNPHPTLEKSNSMSHLYDMFNRARNRRRNFDRPVSYHEDAVHFDDEMNGHEYDSLMANNNNASSLDELEQQSSDEEKSNFFRKAASLCELQNEKFKEGFAKLERRVCSGHSCSIEENSETWFPRLSFEDCSTCNSCRSKSSSYHSLLYDTDTASGYQIYQPTVCDVDSTTNELETDDSCDITTEPTKMTLFKSRKDKIMRQGQEALGTFKDRLRKTKSNPFK